MPPAESEGFDNATPNYRGWEGRTKVVRHEQVLSSGESTCKCRVSVLVLLLAEGDAQEFTHKVSLSHGRWEMKVQIDRRGSGGGLFWLGHDQQKCGDGRCLRNDP